MDLSTVKNVTPNRHLFKKMLAVLFSLVVIVVSYQVITNANHAAKETVEVLRVRQSGGMPAFSVLTDSHLEKYQLIKKEYTSDMVLAEEMPEVVNKLNSYFLRDKSILYKDELIKEKPQKNEWLYKLDDKQEVLTVPYNFLEAGGDILMPGDRVRIRLTYKDESQSASGNPNAPYAVQSGGVTKTEVLFDSIIIKDMLNSNSHSIYEVYKEVQRLSEDKREEVMKSDDFLRNIQPRALLLEGSKEQIDQYAKYNSLEGKAFLITILTRNGSDAIVDQLPTLQNEVESWIEKKKKS